MATKRPTLKSFYIEGIAVWPSLNTPDTKFDADGKYHTKLKVDPEPAEELRALAVEAAEAFMAEKREELQEQAKNGKDGKAKAAAKKALENLKLADPSINEDVDDDGEPTGLMIVNASMPASFKSKKDKDAEGNPKVIAMKPTICDAQGKVLKNPPVIWGGSKLCLKIDLRPYFNAKDSAVGASLRLAGVQILELVTKGSGGSNPGFKAREGYSADDDQDTTAGDGEGTPAGDDNEPSAGAHEF